VQAAITRCASDTATGRRTAQPWWSAVRSRLRARPTAPQRVANRL